MNEPTETFENAAPEWPVLRAWLDGKNPTGLAADLMEVEVASIIREVERLRAEVAELRAPRRGSDCYECDQGVNCLAHGGRS